MTDRAEFGPTLMRKMPMDDAVAHLEKLIDNGQVRGFYQIAIVKTDVPGIIKYEGVTFDLTIAEAYTALCSVKGQMESVFGFSETKP